MWLVCRCAAVLLSSALRWEIILVQLDPSISTKRRVSPFLLNFYQLRSLSLYQDTHAHSQPLSTYPLPFSVYLSLCSPSKIGIKSSMQSSIEQASFLHGSKVLVHSNVRFITPFSFKSTNAKGLSVGHHRLAHPRAHTPHARVAASAPVIFTWRGICECVFSGVLRACAHEHQTFTLIFLLSCCVLPSFPFLKCYLNLPSSHPLLRH